MPELLGGFKSYDYLPPGWKNIEAIADVANGTPGQVYNLISRQWQPEAVKDYWEPGEFLVVRCGRRGLLCFQWGVDGGEGGDSYLAPDKNNQY
ncbi:hypothetical protein H6G97_51480 [Nostoc flagelliforme FACHB-838]|uniref:Uncharacterized protein n=1 Tax=Nostoc flagelliforme FACHB-838 TaxID=2692904 RepID=A0ABR8E6N0_9NOSO|nr:hypothetical protein [Nostoc flagelliforme]MBD2537160.1 hypothetical protein [Nostoc flagelliforme FACHB-838]